MISELNKLRNVELTSEKGKFSKRLVNKFRGVRVKIECGTIRVREKVNRNVKGVKAKMDRRVEEASKKFEQSRDGLTELIWERFFRATYSLHETLQSDRGDVPGWVLVVLMTTGLVTGIWTLAAPRIDSILRNSLDSMNGIR